MKKEIKNSLKELLENLLSGKKYDINEKHKLGFTIAQFILFKEHTIKKSEINNCSKITFNFTINEKYLEPIYKLSDFVKENALEIADNGNIELIGTNDNKVKDSIWIFHLIRNAFAHGEYTIENNYFKINNKTNSKSTLVCDIPITLIENFNSECTKIFNKNLDENYPNDITNIFFNHNLNSNDNMLLYKSLYTYMALTFADMDKDIYIVNIKSAYMQPIFTSENHQFNIDKTAVNNCVEDCYEFELDLNRLYEYLSANHYHSKAQKEKNLRNNLIDKINKRYLQSLRAIRNAIEHANFLVNDDGSINLYDMNNQDDLESKTYEIKNTPRNFFDFTRDIEENKTSNDEFTFLNDILLISDSTFLDKLKTIENWFIEILESEFYCFIITIEHENHQSGIIEDILYIIYCLKNREDNYLNTKDLIIKLIYALEQLAKITRELENQFDNICDSISYHLESDSETFITNFKKFIINLFFVRLSTINCIVKQEDVLTIIDNHTLVCKEYNYVKKLMK